MAETNNLDAPSIGRFMTSFFKNNWTPNYTIEDILNLTLAFLRYPDIILNELEQIALTDAIEHLSI